MSINCFIVGRLPAKRFSRRCCKYSKRARGDCGPCLYARLVVANQTYTGPATFGVFPAIVSFGTGYVQEGSLSYFASSNANARNNVEMVRGPMLDSKRISKTKDLSELLGWIHEDPLHSDR